MTKKKICRNRLFQRLIDRFKQKGGRVAARPLPSESGHLLKRLPKDHVQAARTLVDMSTLNSSGYRKKLLFAPWERSHPDILEFERRFRKELQRRGIPMFAFEFYRSGERQDELKQQGRSKAGAGSSPHNYGCAVDIVHYPRFWDLTPKQWAVIGAIGKEVARKANIPISWGGEWNFYDPAHWELADWRLHREAQELMAAQGIDIPVEDRAYFALRDSVVKSLKIKKKQKKA